MNHNIVTFDIQNDIGSRRNYLKEQEKQLKVTRSQTS